jgi:hypothetical protein
MYWLRFIRQISTVLIANRLKDKKIPENTGILIPFHHPIEKIVFSTSSEILLQYGLHPQ